MAGLKAKHSIRCATSFLKALDAEKRSYVDPYGAFSEAGLVLSATVPRGCHGFVTVDEVIRVRIDYRGHPMAVQHRGGHEAGHLAMMFWDLEWPHHEPTTDRVGLCVRIPEASIGDAVNRYGLDIDRLQSVYPCVYPSEICTRIAMHLGGYAILQVGHSKKITANDVEIRHELLQEMRQNQLAASVLATGKRQECDDGTVALPFRDPGQEQLGVAVIVPPPAA